MRDVGNGELSIGTGKTGGIPITEDGERFLWKNGDGRKYPATIKKYKSQGVTRKGEKDRFLAFVTCN